jgi:tRNA (cmo5U34)-methyltransferase
MSSSSEQFDAAAYFNQDLAARYERRIRSFCPSYDALHQMLAPLLDDLPEHAAFLSAGAGSGAEIAALGARFPSWRFAAVDLSSDMLDACRSRMAEAGLTARVTFFNGRVQDFRAPAPFDAASSIFVAHFINSAEEKLAYFRAIAAALRPGGRFILADLFGATDTPEFARLFRAWLAFRAAQGVSAEELAQDRAHIERDISFVPERDLLALLAEAGFAAPTRFYQTYLFGGWVTEKRRAP